MTPSELRAAISRQIEQATGAVGDEISAARADAFDRYMGQPYGDETENRSSVVSTDVADTIEWIMPELMEMFAGGDKVASFEPEGPEDEQGAEQETDVLNYVFYRQNDGFMVLYNFIKDGLLQKNGYAKRYWSSKEKVTTEEYEGLTIWEWQAMQQKWAQDDYEVEILRQDVEVDGERFPAEMDGQPVPPEMTDPAISVEVRLTRIDEKMCVESVPVEELLVSPRWSRVSLDGCPFVAHRRTVTISDLIEEGYQEKQVKSLPDAFDDEIAEEKVDRFSARGSSEYDEREEMDDTTREVLVHECYTYVDWDGDGKAELRKITVGGNGYEILKWAETGEEDNEEVENQPFSAWTPVPIPHRHYGRSIAELVTDLQRIKTVLVRQMLDNVYLTNNPTREIAEDGIGNHTLSDLLYDRPGKVVRTALPGHYMEHSPPQFMQQLLPAIEYVDTLRENRTGVTRYNQGLDANSLNKTATGIQKVMTASMKKLQLYARVCAETGLKHLFLGIHGDLRRNASKQMTVRLRNKYITVDPRSWKERADMTISVGLGTGDKELRMGYLQAIIAEQKEHLLAGSPLVNMANLFNAYERFITNAGFKNPEEFFTNPAGNPQAMQPPQQKGGGEADAYLQGEMMKTQQRAQEAEQKVMLDMMKSRMEDDRKRDEMNMKLMQSLIEMHMKAGVQVDIEAMKAQTQQAAALNQPPTNGAGQ